MGFGIARRARSRIKRGLFRRPPDAREVGDRLSWLVRRMERETARKITTKRVELALHPAAPPVVVAVTPDGELEVTGDTWQVGPGYHEHVIERLAPILDELDFVWADEPPPVREAMCAWLAGELRAGRPVVERAYLVPAAVHTMMGPRDAAWKAAVLADPLHAKDAFAWWDSGAKHAALSRALLAMWHDVPWREPLDGAERELMKRVLEDLDGAKDVGVAIPEAERAELRSYLGDDTEARGAIGYRRHDVEVELSGGWSITLPGAFVGKWEDDGARYWATDGARAIEFHSLSADGKSSDELLAVAPENHPVIERISEGSRRGRAEAHDDGDVHVVTGILVEAPHIAILSCKGDRDDERWALATWKSLRHSE